MVHGDNQSVSSQLTAQDMDDSKTLRNVKPSDAALKLVSGFEAVSDALKSRYLAEMLDYYASLSAGTSGLPSPAQFDPTVLPHHMPNLYMVELRPRQDGGTEYHYTMFGTGLRLLFGVDMTGKLIGEFPDHNRVERTAEVFRHIAETGLLTRTAGEFQSRNGMPVWGEALTMPLGDMGTVTHIVADLDYDNR
ncbi:PAS domain-containing protein [Kordiimonas marina]|uniref:PAS domain-containing protein n=1 Tax=Kordiimonas marina TaxID=2872312 RepID=UPI001FF35D96|nr:PAS domain-containing protein [Kordiimonas marina]MCJ9428645.1 PAS domain-containing protein [Kordiimonas marina]